MPIIRLQLVSSSGDHAYPSDQTVRVTLRAEWSPLPGDTTAAVTAFDLLADPLLPRLGDRLIRWGQDRTDESYWNYGPVVSPPPPPPPGYPDAPPPERPGLTAGETAAWATHRAAAADGLVLVHRSPRQDGADPWAWLVDLEYAGVDDPLAEAPQVSYRPVPYQTQEVTDRHGMLKTNSALDPYEEGTPRDRSRRQLTVTRNVPYTGFDPGWGDRFENTLNLLPYRHGTAVRQRLNPDGSPVLADGLPVYDPVYAAPLTAKLQSLQADRVERTKAAVPGRRTYYWRVTAVIEFDVSTFVDNNGNRQPRRWRTVLADAGLRELKDGRQTPVTTGSGAATSPVPLDGAGRANRWLLGPNASGAGDQMRVPTPRAAGRVPFTPGGPTPTHLWYAGRAGQAVSVATPGLLAGVDALTATCVAALAEQALHGVAAVNPDGSFTYTPNSQYVGFDFFTFTVTDTAAGATSLPAVCVVFVADQLKVRVFEEYDPADWTDIAALVGGW